MCTCSIYIHYIYVDVSTNIVTHCDISTQVVVTGKLITDIRLFGFDAQRRGGGQGMLSSIMAASAQGLATAQQAHEKAVKQLSWACSLLSKRCPIGVHSKSINIYIYIYIEREIIYIHMYMYMYIL